MDSWAPDSYFLNSWWPIICASVLTVIMSIRFYMRGQACPSENKITGKVVLITGASGGIGLTTAIQLIGRGAEIILTCRNEDKGKTALKEIQDLHPSAKVNLKTLDVSSLQNIRDFVDDIKKEYQCIDILINNAGIIFYPYEKTEESFELTLATNYLGPFLLSHLLLPLLLKSDNGKIINVSAAAHLAAKIDLNNLNGEQGFNCGQAFGQSKLALILFTRHFGKLLKSTRVTVNAVSPGLVRSTEHLRNSTMMTSFTTKISVWPWMWLFMKSPKQGSQTTVYMSVEPTLNGVTCAYFNDCTITQPSETACDADLAEELYNTTYKMCKLDCTVEDLLQTK